MKKHLFSLMKLAIFLLGFALLLLFASFHFIQADTFNSMTLHELKQRDDIELAVVGSSIAKYHFNPEIIEEITGKTTFNVSITNASLPASIAITHQLLQTSSPEYVVLITEPYNYYTVREDPEAYFNLAPFLNDPKNLADYFLRACKEDGLYLERLLLFRRFGASSLSEVIKTFSLRYAPAAAFARIEPTLAKGVSYPGRGYVRFDYEHRVTEEIRANCMREYSDYYYDLYEGSKAHLRELKRVCDEAGSQLIVVTFPTHTVHALAEPGFAEYNDEVKAFCAELGVVCLPFSHARPELMENLDSYFYDLHHMVGEGGDKLSRAFAQVMRMLIDGESYDHLFYPQRWAYYDELNFTTNAWIVPFDPDGEWNKACEQDEARVRELGSTQDVFLGECNHSPSFTPEFKFVLKNEDGSETLLQDYGVDTLYACERGALDGKTLRVWARIAGHAHTGEVWYDLPVGMRAQ